ncbi:MAG: flap endonuclease [Candidatus Woesearchaeota archaeon]|nr:flap endonuclease [Candidatus Woesearchaeota archaeon]MDN5327393.1 flap endonuclease [Candidatus Woesearchaeota archaeon]
MGVNLKDLVPHEELNLKELDGKIIAIDAFNFLYKFLTTIRQYDGTPLMDSKGRITSHLSGLFFRTANFLAEGLKPVYVFDGKSPELKLKEQERRRKEKEKAKEALLLAQEEERIEDYKKYAMRTASLTQEMVEQSKQLLEAMGVPYIQALSEGEAQAAFLVKKGLAYAVASEDYDSLLFGANVLLKNLSISGRKKLPNKPIYLKVEPEKIILEKVLSSLELNQDQLIVIAILVGTDFNPQGIPGIGPKKALKLVKQYSDFDKLFLDLKWDELYDFSWKSVFEIFKNPEVKEDVNFEFKPLNREKIIKLLVQEFEFSEDRVNKKIDEILQSFHKNKQSSLSRWF